MRKRAASGARHAAFRAAWTAGPLSSGSADAAILINLSPGAYTAQVGAAQAGGVALLEIYEVP